MPISFSFPVYGFYNLTVRLYDFSVKSYIFTLKSYNFSVNLYISGKEEKKADTGNASFI